MNIPTPPDIHRPNDVVCFYSEFTLSNYSLPLLLPRVTNRFSVKWFKLSVCLFLFLVFATHSADLASAQEQDTVRVRPSPPDSLVTPPSDSLVTSPRDSLATPLPSQTPPDNAQPTGPTGGNGLKSPVVFTATDSLIINIGAKDGDTGNLFGTVQIDYGETKMQAHEVEILFEIDELRAAGLASDTGMVGRPQFNQGEEVFVGDKMAFNLRTERGLVTVAETQYDDGQIRGGRVKVTEDSTLFIQDGVYTTCECISDPSYSLRSNKMKVVDQKKIFTGPIQLFLFNIPTPLWLPFGFLPAQNTRRSGLLAPTYGEDESGFYLRDLGWYFALNDYHDLQLRGGIWTSGSWQASSLWRYNRRYNFNGQIYLDYSRLRRGELTDPDFAVRNTSSFRWQHTHTLDPSTSLTSNVNLSTQSYLRAISEQYDDRVSQTISSSISFRKRWASTGRSLSLNVNQNQALATNTTTMTIPNLTFSQSSRKPFARETRPPGSKEQWYEKVTYTYNFSMNNRYNFRPFQEDSLLIANNAEDITWFDALFSIDKYRRATGDNEPFDFRASHRIPINASFSARKISLNVTPNINYTEDWFIRTDRTFLETDPADSTTSVVTASQPGFFALRQFSSSLSANTTIYGIFPLKVGALDGFRHTLRPTLAFTYRPDFGGSFWGYTRSYINANGEDVEYNLVSGVQRGLQQSLSLSLNNVFEARQVNTDSTGTDRSTTLKLLNLDASTSYNFAADSLNLSQINLTARTNLFKNNLSVNFRSAFSPYNAVAVGTSEITVDDYVFDLRRFRFARLTQLSVSASTSFRSSSGSRGRPLETSRATPDFSNFNSPGFNPDAAIANSLGNPTGDQVDFNLPWSLSMDFTYSLQKRLLSSTRTMTLNGRFDFSLTPNWKIQGRTGYDFENKEVVTTNLSFFRDFECWQMSLNWVPFGRFQSFGFNLQVKSGHLRDLLRIQQPRSDVQGRFGGAF